MENRDHLMKWAARASVSVAITLVTLKAYVWWQSASVAMLGSLADSGLDLMASMVTLFAVKTALIPPDSDHRFGHGKAEALAGLFQAMLMGGSGLFLAFESVGRLYAPTPVAAAELVMSVSMVAIVLSFLLVVFQFYVIRRTQSLAIEGDHLHYKGDMLMNVGVIIAAWLSGLGYVYADGLFGLLIAGYIGFGALGIVRPAVDMLMDREIDEQERETIFNTIMATEGVMGVHDLKTRMSGHMTFIQMHIEVDGDLSVRQGHLIADELEATLGEDYPAGDILIHVDPFNPSSSEILTRAEVAKE